MTNRLIREKSPYLLQHAENPVDWYPWGIEAFEEAKRIDKPIFLSIGYATCHWCHVMARESFQDPDIATKMNEAFVNIKVDREELPEVDNLYMEFAQALMSSAGGWPLNIVITPDLKPIFAVTYLPPVARKGMPGLTQFIVEIKMLWESDKKGDLLEQANQIVGLFTQPLKPVNDLMPSMNHIKRAVDVLFEIADPVYGGLKGDPKFPLSYHLNFLLSYALASGDTRGHFFTDLTLDRMQRGGIYDHLGGGFARYAVDQKWKTPHFEKMLYDNALLAKAYTDAWRVMKKPLFEETARNIIDYVLQEMTTVEGSFCSAEDADSEGHEGAFYTWAEEEIAGVLTKEEYSLFSPFYSVSKEGNFEGRNILFAEFSIEEYAEAKKMQIEELRKILDSAKEKLLKKRNERARPFKDDKILCGWNGLMIDALASAGMAFGEPKYLEAAARAAQWIRGHLWKEGRLLRRYRDGDARFPGTLDDYAFMIKAALSLFEAHLGVEWLKWAMEMSEVLSSNFKEEGGAFFPTEEKDSLIVRKCEFYDGSEPSGNGVHAENLLRLYQMTQDDKYLQQAEDILKGGKVLMEAYPPGACYHLLALQRYLDAKGAAIVIAVDQKNSDASEIRERIGKHFSPHSVYIWKDGDLSHLLPNTKDKDLVDGKTAIYICRQDRCEPPIAGLPEIFKRLEHVS